MRKFIPIIVIVAIVVIIGGTIASYYNRFVTLKESVTTLWAQVENQLKRRNDLIPNLIESTKGYMGHEKEVFKHVADARSKLAGAGTLQGKVKAAGALDGAFGRLLAIFERYPDLKANESFARLMDELSGTENRISVERKRYNDGVRNYNVVIKRFPGKVFAGWFNFESAPYFEAPEEEQKVPEVKF